MEAAAGRGGEKRWTGSCSGSNDRVNKAMRSADCEDGLQRGLWGGGMFATHKAVRDRTLTMPNAGGGCQVHTYLCMRAQDSGAEFIITNLRIMRMRMQPRRPMQVFR